MAKLLLFFTVILLISCSDSDRTYPTRNMPADLASNVALLHQAEQLFLSRCADCHGTLAEGRMARADFFVPPAPDFSSPFYHQVRPDYLFWRISEGKTVEPYLSQGSVMPAWGPYLSDNEIWGLIVYLQKRSHP